MNNKRIKGKLLEKCLFFVEDRIHHAEKAMKAAQESANEETKSSAGDKYETGRAMAQQERDKHARQLSEALRLKKVLEMINIGQSFEKVALGSLVITSNASYFISISAGKISLDGIDYFAIAPASPIGQALLNKRKGESFVFNGKTIGITDVT